MASACELTLLTRPPDRAGAASAGLSLAHLSYRIGGGGHLFRASGYPPAVGGLMAVDAPGAGPGEPLVLAHEIGRECAARGFSGVFCAFEGPSRPLLTRMLAPLGDALHRQGRGLWVPSAYAGASPHASVLIPTALSGGSLSQWLREAGGRFGPDRLALFIEPVRADLSLPAPDGQGEPLTPEALAHLRAQLRPAVFFSHELCARYFTYRAQDGGVHFVLFDDWDTIQKKRERAEALGIRRAFLPYAEAACLLPPPEA